MRSAPPAAMRTAEMSSGLAGDLEMGDDRAVLLRQADHVDHAAALALDMRRHAENMADGDDAGAADAGDDDRPRRGRAPAVAARAAPETPSPSPGRLFCSTP